MHEAKYFSSKDFSNKVKETVKLKGQFSSSKIVEVLVGHMSARLKRTFCS